MWGWSSNQLACERNWISCALLLFLCHQYILSCICLVAYLECREDEHNYDQLRGRSKSQFIKEALSFTFAKVGGPDTTPQERAYMIALRQRERLQRRLRPLSKRYEYNHEVKKLISQMIEESLQAEEYKHQLYVAFDDFAKVPYSNYHYIIPKEEFTIFHMESSLIKLPLWEDEGILVRRPRFLSNFLALGEENEKEFFERAIGHRLMLATDYKHLLSRLAAWSPERKSLWRAYSPGVFGFLMRRTLPRAKYPRALAFDEGSYSPHFSLRTL